MTVTNVRIMTLEGVHNVTDEERRIYFALFFPFHADPAMCYWA